MINTYLVKMADDLGEMKCIDGQMEGTLTLGGTPIDITNKCTGGYIEYLPDFLASKQVVFAGSFQMLNAASLTKIKAAAEMGSVLAMEITTGVGTEKWRGNFLPNGRSDTAALNAMSTMSVTLSSSGAYEYTDPEGTVYGSVAVK